MEHSQFIEDYGLPIIVILVFIAGIVIGLNIPYYLDKNNDTD